MTDVVPRKPDPLTKRGTQSILARLRANKPVRRNLSDWGRLHVDRQLPFLCVYRKPPGRDNVLTGKLLVAEASYLLVSSEGDHHEQLSDLVRAIAQLMVERFGAFLLIEVWAQDEQSNQNPELPEPPGFFVYQQAGDRYSSTINTLTRRLEGIRSLKQRAEVSLINGPEEKGRPQLPPLISVQEAEQLRVHTIGIGIRPIYYNRSTGESFPLVHRALKRQLGRALDQAFYEFARENTTLRPSHYYALGRRTMVSAVWEADRRLAAVADSYDLLYQVTPVNAEDAWRQFQRDDCQRAPRFLYRPRPIDPSQMKRVLFAAHIERVEDPTLMNLFLDRQLELERELSMLQDIGSRNFLYGSLQIHGPVSPDLLQTARLILDKGPSEVTTQEVRVGSKEFARRAGGEIAWYARRNEGVTAEAEVSEEMYSGLMVSRNRLLVGKGLRVPESRVNALIQHEVGTHLLTYINGQAQPFRMLATGMPGYEELQEGLAVIAEFMVGGLSRSRLRILAARVIAAHGLLDGGTFVDVFRRLHDDEGFSRRSAYTVAMRVFRGGGLLKDAVYLRGLQNTLKLLADGVKFDVLFAGKIGVEYLPVIRELLHRKILIPPVLMPRYMTLPEAKERIDQLRIGLDIRTLVEST